MLHNEARKLLIQALEKTHNAREVAENFSVNRGTVYRLKKQLDETGSIETRTYLRGRKPALSKENIQSIEQLLQAKPDITIAEIIDTLQLKTCIMNNILLGISNSQPFLSYISFDAIFSSPLF